MSHTIGPSDTYAELRQQHDEIRLLADRAAARAARQYGDDEPSSDLRLAMARLRIAVGAHNRFEESVLEPLLLTSDAFGPVRVSEMIHAHAFEHALMISAMDADTVAGLRDAITELRRHLESEEREFLSSKIIRDDLVTVEGGA